MGSTNSTGPAKQWGNVCNMRVFLKKEIDVCLLRTLNLTTSFLNYFILCGARFIEIVVTY